MYSGTNYNIFISYRRVDSEGRISGRELGRSLKFILEKHPFENAYKNIYKVFFDYDDITNEKFANDIIPAIQNCKVFILVLSKDAMERCRIEDDWVRREIRIALKSGCKIVNVRPIDPDDPSNTFSGWPKTLPEELKPITDIDIAEIEMGKNLIESIAKLEKEHIRDVIPPVDDLSEIIKKGRDIRVEELYFDPERTQIKNGFYHNKYFPRRSVDGLLEEALLLEQRKYMVLLGAPASGKTRALYQLIDPKIDNRRCYAFGALSDCDVIVVKKENLTKVLGWLEWMSENNNQTEASDKEYYMLCDQVKDVFCKLNHDDDLYRFFNLVDTLPSIRMIVTSIPSAFQKFRERWKDYGWMPFDNDQRTTLINIPPISSDPECTELRNWIKNEWKADSFGESIGDYIPKLNKYKQRIVDRIYEKVAELHYLPDLMSAIQTIETYRYDTALFLPILIARNNIISRDELRKKDFHQEMVNTLNYLISNNVIWITDSTGELLPKISLKVFSLQYNGDVDDKDFVFDGESYFDTTISTKYSYGINEILWKHIEYVDANKHIRGEETLLNDFDSAKDVTKAAQEYYRAVRKVSTLRRILPRVPHTRCYEEALTMLWKYIFKACKSIELLDNEHEDFVITLGILISRSKDITQIMDVVNLLKEKDITPNYGIVGELYSAGCRFGEDEKQKINQLVNEVRKSHALKGNDFFSLTREIKFRNLCFDDCKTIINKTSFSVEQNEGSKVTIDNLGNLINNKLLLFSVYQLFTILATKAIDTTQWEDVFLFHERAGIAIHRTELRRFFAVVSEEEKRQQHEYSKSESVLLVNSVQKFIEHHSEIIAKEDRESVYFYATDFAQNFKQAHEIYQIYLNEFGHDNPRLVSIAIQKTNNNEFQTALNFLVEVDIRMKRRGIELSIICFNNLIKKAPNIGEALGIIPYLSHIQEYTLACLLLILKRRKLIDNNSITGRKQDPKVFFYAYSAVMRDMFYDFRTSPFIIGILFSLATTSKHETFIRNIFLGQALSIDKENCELKKRELIDYSTAVASIRIKKNYRDINEIWNIFNICRNHYSQKKLFISSELYSSMMNKLYYLFHDDEAQLKTQLQRLKTIIDEDWRCIIRDEFFLSSLYRFMPDKQILDQNGDISKDFIKDMQLSNILQIKVFNNIMIDLKTCGFETLWKFYEYIVSYYNTHGKRISLMPDYRTVTYLMEAVRTEEQRAMAKEAAMRWVNDDLMNKNNFFIQAQKQASIFIEEDLTAGTVEPSKVIHADSTVNETMINQRNYRQETDIVINLAQKDIYLHGELSPSLLNGYLKQVLNIVTGIRSDQIIREEKVEKCIQGTYWNLYNNLIAKHRDKIMFDIDSYLILVKLSPNEGERIKWVKNVSMIAVDIAIKDINKYGIITSSLLNTYLKQVLDAVNICLEKSTQKYSLKKNLITAVYWNVYNKLIDPYRVVLNFDVNTYITLIKLSPNDKEILRWTEEIVAHKDEFKYNLVVSREIATSVEVSRCDMLLSRTCFEYWENIMKDVGYDPTDPTSVSDNTEISVLATDNVTLDYDSYWSTRSYHVLREMFCYCSDMSKGIFNKDALDVIKKQLDLFNRYNIPFPTYTPRDKSLAVDFEKEVAKI